MSASPEEWRKSAEYLEESLALSRALLGSKTAEDGCLIGIRLARSTLRFEMSIPSRVRKTLMGLVGR